MTIKMRNRAGFKFSVSALFFVLAVLVGISTVSADDLVKNAQEALAERGFDPGPVDGVWGPKTKGAVMKFQKSEGLSATGQLDGTTKSRLLGSMSETAPAMSASSASTAKIMPVGDTGPDVPDSEIVWGRHK